MNKNLSVIEEKLNTVVEDKAILPELVALNMLPFVDRTTFSCSGHADRFGLIEKMPYVTISYIPDNHEAGNFHSDLRKVFVEIEMRKYFLRALDTRIEYFIGLPFGIHPNKDALIGEEAVEIPDGWTEISYQLIIPDSCNFENPANKNVKILEDFWEAFSQKLSAYTDPEIYKSRRFSHRKNEYGEVESVFRK